MVLHQGTSRPGQSLVQIASELSDVACRGRISAKACARVLARYLVDPDDTITLRLRSKEIAEDLEDACKAAEKKRLKKTLVNDIIYGQWFRDGDEDEAAWSGLDAFRKIIENEVEELKESYNGILHSILNVSASGPD